MRRDEIAFDEPVGELLFDEELMFDTDAAGDALFAIEPARLALDELVSSNFGSSPGAKNVFK